MALLPWCKVLQVPTHLPHQSEAPGGPHRPVGRQWCCGGWAVLRRCRYSARTCLRHRSAPYLLGAVRVSVHLPHYTGHLYGCPLNQSVCSMQKGRYLIYVRTRYVLPPNQCIRCPIPICAHGACILPCCIFHFTNTVSIESIPLPVLIHLLLPRPPSAPLRFIRLGHPSLLPSLSPTRSIVRL